MSVRSWMTTSQRPLSAMEIIDSSERKGSPWVEPKRGPKMSLAVRGASESSLASGRSCIMITNSSKSIRPSPLPSTEAVRAAACSRVIDTPIRAMAPTISSESMSPERSVSNALNAARSLRTLAGPSFFDDPSMVFSGFFAAKRPSSFLLPPLEPGTGADELMISHAEVIVMRSSGSCLRRPRRTSTSHPLRKRKPPDLALRVVRKPLASSKVFLICLPTAAWVENVPSKRLASASKGETLSPPISIAMTAPTLQASHA
mmetsp:Transcript_5443/g.11104  ORF Transcript_5443/g.11104 Transcript_5443/m.11104 type:complete len:259 (-) Transcript_5443:777-1553(-)